MKIFVKLLTPVEKYAVQLADGQIGLVSTKDKATIFLDEQPAFECRKEIIGKIGGKAKVTFEFG